MGGGCFRGAASQVHPAPQGVLPADPSLPSAAPTSAAVSATTPAAAASAPATVGAGTDGKLQATQAPPISQPQQGPSAPSAPSAPAKPKPKPSLIKAVKDGNVALIEELLRDGCDIEKLGMWDNTPLLAACTYGHRDAALKLISHGANVHAKNEHGATALHYAAVEGSLSVVEAIIAAARTAGKEGAADPVPGLVNCGQANVYNRHLDAYAMRTPLGSAAESGFADLVSTLLAAGAAVDAVSEEERTALWLACRHSRLSVAKVLLQSGARADAKDAHGVSVLGAALASCQEELVLALLAHGVGDVNDTAGVPLQEAVKAGKRGVVEALLTHGALVQPAKADAPTTPLHVACEKGDEYLVSLLVRAGAEPSRANAAGQTAFDLLRRRGLPDSKIVALLSAPSSSGQEGGTGTTGDAGSQKEVAATEPAMA